jgi:hypothetical protein
MKWSADAAPVKLATEPAKIIPTNELPLRNLLVGALGLGMSGGGVENLGDN